MRDRYTRAAIETASVNQIDFQLPPAAVKDVAVYRGLY
jgi:hypothetical protein